uniref:Uncharacterized protein n=1 Tax=Acrobeloides nanus TaxID=290746 RepID=A0A914D1I1_9BILA
MGSVFTKEEMENEAIDETSNSATANLDTDSSFESINETTIETEEKHESLQEKVNEQKSQEKSTNDKNKQETNDEFSKLTNEFTNAHIQEQTQILDTKVQGGQQKSKFYRCLMQTGAKNEDTGVTKSIFDAQHANNDKTPPGKSETPIPLENQFQQPGSSQTMTQSYVQPTQQNNYQTHGNHGFISPIIPDPLTAPLLTVQGYNNEHSISSFPYPPHQSTLAPASQQQHFPQMVQHNQHLIGTGPGTGYGTEKSNINWNPAPNHNQATTHYHPPQQSTFVPAPHQHYVPPMEQHNQGWTGTDPRARYGTEQPNWNSTPNYSQMQAATNYQPPQQPTLVPAPQQHYFPQVKQHNQGWSGTGPRAGYGTELGQQNMNYIPDQIHNQMQAMETTSNITNHPAPINHPSTSASQGSHTGKKGRPRLSDDSVDIKSIKARGYNKTKRDHAKLGAKISENLDSFCKKDRALIERFKTEIDNTNGNQEPDSTSDT